VQFKINKQISTASLTRGHKKREALLASLLFGIRAFESDILSHLTFIIPNLFFEQREMWGGKFFQAFLFKAKRDPLNHLPNLDFE